MKRIVLLLVAAVLFFSLAFVSCKTGKPADYSLIPVSNDGERWGFINRKGEFVINPQFEEAGFFSDGLAMIKSNGGKTGYINKKGAYVIPATYRNGTAFSDGLAFVVPEGGMLTCIDKKGEMQFVLHTAQYVSEFSEGLAVFVTEAGEYGFVDKTGNIIINAQFEKAYPFCEGFSRIRMKGDEGFIDKAGNITVNPQFNTVGNFSEGKALFSDGKQWGYINTKGAYVVNPQFDDAGRFSQGLAAVRQGKSYGFINEKGKLVINPQFDHASFFSDGLAAVQAGSRYGYISKDGKYEINAQFEYAGNFYNGIALVRNADKWGFINKKGKYVVNPQFNRVKTEPAKDARPDMVESDYYDTSGFIKLFFGKDAGNTFDGINASTTLEQLSDHPLYGAHVNARGNNTADYRQTIPLTKDIAIGNVAFIFNSTPIYTYNNWGGRGALNLNATPDAIVYRLNLNGKAWEKSNVVFGAVKSEIERRYGQAMRRMPGDREAYCLYRDPGNLCFAVDGNDAIIVSFNKEYLVALFGE